MIQVSLRGSLVVIASPYSEENVARARAIPGGRYVKALKVWTYPLSAMAEIRKTYNGEAEYSSELLARFADSGTHDAEVDRTIFPYLSETLPNGMTLRKHQVEGVEFLVRNKKVILRDGTGLGKTITSLVAAKWWKKEKGLRIIVLAPSKVHIQWWNVAGAQRVMLEAVYSWAATAIPPPDGPYVLIADEAHYAQNLSSKRTRRFLELAAGARAVYALTATPMKNGLPRNLFPLLVAVEHPLGANKFQFEAKYCQGEGGGKKTFKKWTVDKSTGERTLQTLTVKDTAGASNLKDLYEKTKGVMLGHKKSECLDLPPKTRVIVPAEVSAAHEVRYHEDVRIAIEAYEERGGDETAKAMVLLQAQRHAAARAKTESTIATMKELAETGRKCVVFASNVDVVEDCARLLDCEFVHGQISMKSREEIIQKFVRGESQFLALSNGVGGESIDGLQRQCSDGFIIDRPWTPGDCDQIEGRLERDGQIDKAMWFWPSWGAGDEKIDPLLDRKSDRIDLALNGELDTLPRAFSIESMAVAIAESIIKSER